MRRERRLRLVQDVESLLETVGEQGEEGLAVRLLQQRLAAVGPQVRHLLNVGGEVVEALRAHEESLRHLGRPRQPQSLSEIRALLERGAQVVAVAPLRVEAAALRQRLQQSRLAAAVLAHEESHVIPEGEIDPLGEGADIEGMARGVELLRQAGHLTQKRRPGFRGWMNSLLWVFPHLIPVG